MPTLLPKPLSPQPTHAAPGLPAPQGVCVSEEDHLQPQQHRCSNTVEVRSAAASHCGSRSPSRTTYARGGVEGRRIYTPLQEETSNSSYSSRRGSTPMMMMMMADASSSSSSPMCRTSPIGAVRSSPPRHHRTGRPPMMQQHRQPMMESKGQPTTTTFSAHNNINKNHTHVGSTRVQAAAALHGRVKSVEKARPTSVFVSSPPKTRIAPPATTTTTTTASASAAPSTEWRTKHEAATTTSPSMLNAHSARSTAAVEEVRKVKQNARPPPQPRTRSPTINAASSSVLVMRASPTTTTATRERCARRDAEASSTRSSSPRLPHGYVEALAHIQRSLLTEARRQRLRNTNNKAEMLRQRQQLFRQYSSIPPHTQERRRQIHNNNNNITTTTSPSCSAETVEGAEEAWRRSSSSPRSPRSKTTSTDERGFSHPLRCARDEDEVVEQMGATLGTSPRRARTPPRPWSGDDVPLRARMTVRCVKGVAGQHHWRCVQCEDDLFDALHNTVPQRVVEEMAPRTCTHNNTNTNNIIYPSSIDDVLQWLDEVQAKRGRRLTKTHA